jgi:hypothetical protein
MDRQQTAPESVTSGEQWTVQMRDRDGCPCTGRRWVEDENWSPPFRTITPYERTEHDGLIPCGFCNEGGWSTPQYACDICDDRPCLPNDCMCAECRQWVTDSSDLVVDPVERAMSAHSLVRPLSDLDRQLCSCGWSVDSGPAVHRRHQAHAIYAALGLDGPVPWELGPKSTMREEPPPAARSDR